LIGDHRAFEVCLGFVGDVLKLAAATLVGTEIRTGGLDPVGRGFEHVE